VSGPVPLVLDLRISHERFGSSSDPSINGHLHYPNDVDRSLNETDADKIRKYRADYMTETFTKIKPTDPLILVKQAV
jgi:hypothetical protein